MTNTWIMVANASNANIYGVNDKDLPTPKRFDIEVIHELTHPESRKKDEDITSDRLGNFRGGFSGHGSFVDGTDPKEFAAESFAKELAQILEKGRTTHRYEKLIIISGPHFQGLLNKNLSEATKQLIMRTIDKDYTKDNVHELRIRLQKLFALPEK